MANVKKVDRLKDKGLGAALASALPSRDTLAHHATSVFLSSLVY